MRVSLVWLDHLRRDIRHSIRGLHRAPAFAVAVILTLGLGIGVNAAIFGVVDRLMFRPLPYLRDPGSVDRVYLRTQGWNRGNAYSVFLTGSSIGHNSEEQVVGIDREDHRRMSVCGATPLLPCGKV